MRKLLLYIMIQVLSVGIMAAQNSGNVFERTYLSTDKNVYVAGDRIWCSAFCFDVASRNMSKHSSIAYLELVSDGAIIQTAKVALEGGRGSGYIDIPESVPTGNYRLVAFTSENKNEQSYDFLTGSKVVSVLNPVSTAKIKDGVEVVDAAAYSQMENVRPASSGQLRVNVPSDATQGKSISLNLGNISSDAVSLSVSVYHDDGIISLDGSSIAGVSLPSVSSLSYQNNVYPDVEGEVIYGNIVGKDASAVIKDLGVTAYISTPGSLNDTYTSIIGQDGTVAFKTYNIFGNKDLVCEIADLSDESLEASINLKSPFVNVGKVDVPVLPIAESMRDAVIARGRSMQLFKEQYVDSLYQLRARKDVFPYLIKDAKLYNLDDYTRFPTVREVLVEITQDVRVRGRNNKQRIQVLSLSEGSALGGEWKTSLVLLDGVPVFKHSDMMDYDAMLLQGLEVWADSYFFGERLYDGVVNFVSKSGNMAFMEFGSNVKIVDYQGACYPVDYSQRHNPAGSKDMRRTIYWNPELEIEAGKDVTLDCQLPDYPGKFDVVIEGVTSDGQPIYKWTTFVVK